MACSIFGLHVSKSVVMYDVKRLRKSTRDSSSGLVARDPVDRPPDAPGELQILGH